MVNIHNILKFDPDRILDLRSNLNIRFDDDVVVYNASFKKIILFKYLIDFLPRYNVPITSDLWIDNFIKNNLFTNKTYLGIYSKIFKTIVKRDIAINKSNKIMHMFLKDMYQAITTINAKLVYKVLDYAVSVNITDILAIQYNKDLLDSLIKSDKEKSVHAINKTYATLDKIIKDTRYKGNPIRLFYMSGIVSIDQIKQLLGSRGFVTEIDSTVFSRPMTNSFALGFKNMYDATIESRAGAKALLLSTSAIRDSEYMSRELQLATMLIKSVHIGDCGHPTYVNFYVKPPEYDEDGSLTYIGDLPHLVGKRYKLTEDGEERVIKGDEYELNGKFILLRFAPYCGLKDKHKICSACIGEIAETIFAHQNLGNLATVNYTSRQSQSLLSAKHLLKSATVSRVVLPYQTKKYFLVKNSEDYKGGVYFKANVLNKKKKRVYIKIRQNEAWGLDTIMNVKDILSININKISRLSEIILVYKSGGEDEEIRLPLKVGNRFARLSLFALSYVIKSGYEVFDEDYYILDINDFNRKLPFLKYDEVEFDYSALGKEFKRLLKTRKFKIVKEGNMKIIRSEFTTDVLVQNMFELVNKKLGINIALLEIIAYAFTAQNLNEQNYDLGRNAVNHDVIGFRQAIDYRSLGAAYGWDYFLKKVIDPISFIEENKPDSPLDVRFAPQEVVDAYLKKINS